MESRINQKSCATNCRIDEMVSNAPSKVQTKGQSDQIEPPTPDFWELGYSFSGSCRALVFILGESGSKHILLQI